MTDNDPAVLEFRLQRLRRAPRNWTYWVAGFTAVNGLFLAMQQDMMILAGLVAPFGFPGVVPHLVAAAVFAALAHLSSRRPKLLYVALGLYLADAVFAGVAGIWAGVVMHAVVLAFVWFSFRAARMLEQQRQAQFARREL